MLILCHIRSMVTLFSRNNYFTVYKYTNTYVDYQIKWPAYEEVLAQCQYCATFW